MKKEEFLKTLKKRLDVLEDSEIEDILSEYEGYIEEKVKTGLSEEEAVKELGDIEEIVKDLLAAYKVKDKKEESSFNNFINKISDGIDSFMESLNEKSAKDIIRVLVEVIIILFLLCILKIPFAMIKDLGINVFEELANPVGNIFCGLWSFIIELSYVIIAIVFFIKMFQKRYFKGVSEKIIEETENEIEETKEEKKKKTKKEKIEEPKPEKKVIVEKKHSFIDALTDICIVILKFFAIFFIIGTVCFLIGTSIALGFMIYLICKGVTYIGILLIIIALFLGGEIVLELLIDFIFNKKVNATITFSKLIVSIIILGIGLAISAVEISNTEIIYDTKKTSETKIVSKEIPMQDNLKFYYYDNIIIDNDLKDTIKLEYKYPDFGDDLKIDIDLEKCGRGYCLHTELERFKYSNKWLNRVIDDLKDKKIYAHEYKVEKNIYMSDENYNKIMNNKNYYEEDNKEYTFTRTYEVLNVTDSSDGYYYNVTLNQYNDFDVATVKVLKTTAGTLENNKNYEFTFRFVGREPDDDIEDIFDECTLISVKQTDQIGLNQKQEPFKGYNHHSN